MKKFIVALPLLMFATLLLSQSTMYEYPNLVHCTYFPRHSTDADSSYSARGIWFGFTLPAIDDTAHYGSFGGPYSYFTKRWLAPSLLSFSASLNGKDKIDLSKAKNVDINIFPGDMQQRFTFDSLIIELHLIPIGARVWLYQAYAINTGDKAIDMTMNLTGEVFAELGEGDVLPGSWLFKIDNRDDVMWLLRYNSQTDMQLIYSTDNYDFGFKTPQHVLPNDTLDLTVSVTQTYKFDNINLIEATSNVSTDTKTFIRNNALYWNKIIAMLQIDNESLKRLCLKAFMTISHNLRAQLPRHNFFTSVSGTNLPVMNVDNTWFEASALTYFDFNLAKHLIMSILQAQNDDGSFDKYIHFGSDEWQSPVSGMKNEKPMLAWTVWNLYQSDHSDVLMRAGFDKLLKYHDYWYTHRDNDGDHWCEDVSNIETVALNAMLFTEKHCLKKIANIMGKDDIASRFADEMDFILKNFHTQFYDATTGRYCDYDNTTSQHLFTDNALEFCLYSGLAATPVAQQYVSVLEQQIASGAHKKWFKSGVFEIENFYLLTFGLRKFGFNEVAERIEEELVYYLASTNDQYTISHFDFENSIFVENSTLASAIILLLLAI